VADGGCAGGVAGDAVESVAGGCGGVVAVDLVAMAVWGIREDRFAKGAREFRGAVTGQFGGGGEEEITAVGGCVPTLLRRGALGGRDLAFCTLPPRASASALDLAEVERGD